MVNDQFLRRLESKNRRISAGFTGFARRRADVPRSVNDPAGINHSLTKFVDS
jgi:hypothetical protein